MIIRKTFLPLGWKGAITFPQVLPIFICISQQKFKLLKKKHVVGMGHKMRKEPGSYFKRHSKCTKKRTPDGLNNIAQGQKNELGADGYVYFICAQFPRSETITYEKWCILLHHWQRARWIRFEFIGRFPVATDAPDINLLEFVRLSRSTNAGRVY